MWPSTLIFDEENSKHFSLAQQNVFGPACCGTVQRLVKGTTQLKPVGDWLDSLSPCGSPAYYSPEFWFYGWAWKKSYITKLGCEKYFCEKY
jgi:hypothetical protein